MPNPPRPPACLLFCACLFHCATNNDCSATRALWRRDVVTGCQNARSASRRAFAVSTERQVCVYVCKAATWLGRGGSRSHVASGGERDVGSEERPVRIPCLATASQRAAMSSFSNYISRMYTILLLCSYTCTQYIFPVSSVFSIIPRSSVVGKPKWIKRSLCLCQSQNAPQKNMKQTARWIAPLLNFPPFLFCGFFHFTAKRVSLTAALRHHTLLSRESHAVHHLAAWLVLRPSRSSRRTIIAWWPRRVDAPAPHDLPPADEYHPYALSYLSLFFFSHSICITYDTYTSSAA